MGAERNLSIRSIGRANQEKDPDRKGRSEVRRRAVRKRIEKTSKTRKKQLKKFYSWKDLFSKGVLIMAYSSRGGLKKVHTASARKIKCLGKNSSTGVRGTVG